jgi:UDP-glucose 4-epimerase
MEAQTILVTGGAGFVGSNLVARLVQDGHRVISLDNYFAGTREAHVDGAEYRDGHTKDIATLIPESIDIIFHLGEYARVEQSVLEPEVVHDLNVVGTAAVIEFWRAANSTKPCKLVYAGSSTKFGDGGTTPETSPYAKTKAENTIQVRDIGEKEKLPYAITYFYNVYGTGERTGVYGTVIRWFKEMYLRGEPITIVSPGTQTRNFTHVDDVVDALIRVAEKGEGDEFGIGGNRAYTMLEVAHLFGGEVVMLPPRTSNRMTSELHTEKTRTLGWTPVRDLATHIIEFVTTHPRGESKEQRVLVLSTTFCPVSGPAEDALCLLMHKMPSVKFDIITTAVSGQSTGPLCTAPNASIYRVGLGNRYDKYFFPFLSIPTALRLHRAHRYLFVWSLFASYAALAALVFRSVSRVPLLVTLADQSFGRLSRTRRLVSGFIMRHADQVYAQESAQEDAALKIARRVRMHRSLGHGDAFANQIRYLYADILRTSRK